ncbi:MAG: amidohydrolase family protein [Rhodospirillales bacterium]|nr:amidohydrolase family protein [Rhodospirillales bacterium]
MTNGPAAGMKIDMHAHFYGGGLENALRRRRTRPCLREGADGGEYLVAMNSDFPFTAPYFDIATGLEQMRSLGITHRLLTFPGSLGFDVVPAAECAVPIAAFNDHLATMARDTGGAIIGLAGLPLADIEMAGMELARVRRELNLPGAIIPSNYFNSIEDARRMEPLLEVANRHGAHLMLHPGLRDGEDVPPPAQDHPQFRVSAVALQSQVSQNVLTLVLSEVLDTYPDISFHVVNLGGTVPFIFERMESIARHRSPDQPFPTERLRRIWYDCASLGPRALEAAVKVYGADRIMIGSDYPIFQSDPYATTLVPARITDHEREEVASGTARRLLERLGTILR